MARRKTFKKTHFADESFCFEENPQLSGKWETWFNNKFPITLELGCGKAELSLGIARLFPERNVIGIDVKSDRLYVAAQEAVAQSLTNLAFIELNIQALNEYFEAGEIDKIWITFPDPYPKKRHTKRRLTHKRFLDVYKEVLKPGGLIQFKTDNAELFDWTLEHFEELGIHPEEITRDLHHSPLLTEETGLITTYERKFMEMGVPINYMTFRLS